MWRKKLNLYKKKKINKLSIIYLWFFFVLQNDNDLIDKDNAGQSAAAQAVVLTLFFSYLQFFSTPSCFFFALSFLADSSIMTIIIFHFDHCAFVACFSQSFVFLQAIFFQLYWSYYEKNSSFRSCKIISFDCF